MLLWPIVSGVAKEGGRTPCCTFRGAAKLGLYLKNRKGKRIMRGVAKKFRGMRQKARGGGKFKIRPGRHTP